MILKKGTIIKLEFVRAPVDYAFLELTDNIMTEDSLVPCKVVYTNNKTIFYWDGTTTLPSIEVLKRTHGIKITEIGDNAKAIEVLYGR